MMKSIASLLAVLWLTAFCPAQGAPAPPPAQTSQHTTSAAAPNSAAPPAQSGPLAAGTVISAELAKSLDARKIKANDRVEAKISMDLLSRGQIVVPRNTKIIGHVTEVKARSKESPDSMIGIAFDQMVLKDGHELPLQAAVQALGRPVQTALSLYGTEPAEDASGGISGTPPMIPQAPFPAQYPNRGGRSSQSGAAGPAGSTVNTLDSMSHGVIGMKGLSLNTSGSASVVSSNTDNVHLDSGTQLILRVQ
jgi:hypothetical protein